MLSNKIVSRSGFYWGENREISFISKQQKHILVIQSFPLIPFPNKSENSLEILTTGY